MPPQTPPWRWNSSSRPPRRSRWPGRPRCPSRRSPAAVAAGREPPSGWIHTATFLQARGGLRVAQGRHVEALDDLLAAGEGWRALGIDNPAVASWRTAAAAAQAALGRPEEAAVLAAEQLALARKVGTR